MRRCVIRNLTCGLHGVAWATLVAASLSSGLGCGEASPDGLNHKAVYGKVTLDGTPLAKGVISFDPAEGSPGTIPVGGVVTDGSYSMDSSSGPTPGKYKVSIRSAASAALDDSNGPGPSPKKVAADPIPKKYNTNSTLTAEVQASGSTTADFALTSK